MGQCSYASATQHKAFTLAIIVIKVGELHRTQGLKWALFDITYALCIIYTLCEKVQEALNSMQSLMGVTLIYFK